MVPILRCSAAILCPIIFAAVIGPSSAGQVKKTPLDFKGDPLPEGAFARHGTTRLRHKGAVSLLAFTPDGKSLLSFGNDQTYRQWDCATGQEQWRLDKEERQLFSADDMNELELFQGIAVGGFVQERRGEFSQGITVAHTADGKLLAHVQNGNQVIVEDTKAGKKLRTMVLKGKVSTIALEAAGNLLAIGEWNGEEESVVRQWNLITGKEAFLMKMGSRGSVTKLVFSKDCKQLAGIIGVAVLVWDVATGKRTRHYAGHDRNVTDIAFSQDCQLLASASLDCTVRIWETTSQEQVKKLSGDESPFMAIAFMPDGKSVVAGDRRGFLHIWNLASGKDHILNDPAGSISVMAVSPDGLTISTANDTGLIRLWDTVTGEEKKVAKRPESFSAMRLVDGGATLVLWYSSGQLRYIDTSTGVEHQVIKAPIKANTRVIASADSQMAMFIDGEDGSVHLWDVAEGAEPRKLRVPPGGTRHAAFSPDGQLVFTAEAGGALRLWKVATGKQVFHNPEALAVGGTFSPDGKLLAVLTRGGQLSVVELLTGKERYQLPSNRFDSESPAVFSPNGRLLATGGDDVVRVWDVVHGKALRGLVGHQGWVAAIAFSPKGDILASGGSDGTVRLWKLDTGEEIRCFTGHLSGVHGLAFSDDGKMLISAGRDNCILVWDTASRAAVKQRDTSVQSLERCYADLGNDDLKIASRAMGEMMEMPKETVAFLAMKLQPAPALDSAVIDKLVAELDSSNFAIRQKATKALEKLEGAAGPALKKVLATSPSAESKSRAKELLDRIDAPVTAPDDLRNVRAVETLERVGTTAARDLLARLAKGAPGARLTAEAAMALPRMAK